MAVLTTQYLNNDFQLLNTAKWQILVEAKCITALALQNNQLVSFHQIGFINNIEASDVNNITSLAIIAGISNLHFYYYTNCFTLVPSSYYNFNNKEDYLNLLFGNTKNQLVKSDLNYNINSYVVSGINEELYRSLMVGVANTSITNWHNAMINFAYKYNQDEDVAFVNCLTNSFTITIKQQSTFKYMYAFPYTKPEEICYKLLHVFSVFNLSSTQCKVLLMGNVNDNSLLYNELFKFFAHIQFITLQQFPSEYTHHLSVPEHQLFPSLICSL